MRCIPGKQPGKKYAEYFVHKVYRFVRKCGSKWRKNSGKQLKLLPFFQK